MNHPPPIGKNIQAKRKEKKMSLDTLAKRSGVSKSMISQIEQEKTNPTIVTAWKIARALSLSVPELLENKEGSLIEITRYNDAPVTPTNDGLGTLKVNSPLNTPDNTELYTLTLAPGGVNESGGHGQGAEEYLLILKGQIVLQVGEHIETLGEGDTAYYNADTTHIASNNGEVDAVMLIVVNMPK